MILALGDPRALDAAARALVAAGVLSAVTAGALLVSRLPAFDIRGIEVEAADGTELRHVSEAMLRSAGAHRVQGGFFAVDIDAVRDAFEQVPWVRTASVRRVWPNRLHVAIEEHRALGLWGEGQMLNTHGEVFTANVAEAEADAGADLPEFAGPAGTHGEVLRRWRELRTQLAPLGSDVASLQLSPRWAWTARLADGTTVVLGREHEARPMAERVQRLVAAWPEVAPRLGRATAIDLRYVNGFAVRVANDNKIQKK